MKTFLSLTKSNAAIFFILFISIISSLNTVFAQCSLKFKSKQDVTCYNACNGSITVTVSNGTAPYTYTWETFNAQYSPIVQVGSTADQTVTGLCPNNNWTVVLTDGNGCTSTLNDMDIWQPSAVTATAYASGQATCGQNNGSANATASGGTGTLTYKWSTGQNGMTANNLPTGISTVTVTDSKGCSATSSVNITNAPSPLQVSVIAVHGSCGSNSGSAIATISNGSSGMYTYSWSNGSSGITTGTTISVSGLSSTSYTVTVTEYSGCASTTASAYINQGGGIILSPSSTTPDYCSNHNGSATANPSGGTSPYTYLWSNNQTTPTAIGLTSGNYTLTVTDYYGCTSTTFVNIIQANSSITLNISTIETSCGRSNGSATATISGGYGGPYVYSWSTAVTSITNNLTSTISNVMPGAYRVTVTDASGCSSSSSGNVTQSLNTLKVTINNKMDAGCGENNGSATADISGGKGGAYTFNWSNGASSVTSATTFQLSNLLAGTYIVTVSEGLTCSFTDSAIITNNKIPDPPSICMVTVDSVSKHNIIMWEKASYAKADSFIVYRETFSNTYKRIAAISKNSLSIFVDTVAVKYFPFTGDPNSGTYRYKLQLRDTCGNYSQLSPYHNTIYVTQTAGTFNWNDYKIEGQSVPLPQLAAYYLYRDNIGNNNWSLVGAVSGSQLTINDNNYLSYPNGRWRIETSWSITCAPTFLKTKAYGATKSNIKSSSTSTTIKEEQQFLDIIKIYPNPANNKLNIEFPLVNKNYGIFIFNVLGEVIYSAGDQTGNIHIDISSFSSGVYTISIHTDTAEVFKKLMVD